MNDGTITLPWHVVRQDDNGNRYSVGRYATRAEAQKIADSLDGPDTHLYWVERVGRHGGGAGDD
ncbi:SPOR domain-containing protein [Streptomyces sp. JNUCC 63]